MEKIAELEIRVTELEGVVSFMVRHSIPFSLEGYGVLIAEIRSLRTELAILKADMLLQNIKEIKSN